MFNLDQAIVEWRRQMLAAGIVAPMPLDELESHLREDVRQEMKSGTGEREAFETALERLGAADALKIEFEKADNSPEKRLRRALRPVCMAGVAGAGLWYLRHTYLVFKLGMGVVDESFALAGLGVIVLCVSSLPYLPRLFPVIRNERARLGIMFAFGLSGLFYWMTGRYISLHSSFIDLLLWRIVPYLSVIGFACGLERYQPNHSKSGKQPGVEPSFR